MKVCVRYIGGVMSSGGGERVTPVVVSNRSRDVMAPFSTAVDTVYSEGEEREVNTNFAEGG